MTTSAPTRTDSIVWTGHNLPDVQRFTGQYSEFDRVGLPYQRPAFTARPDGTGRLWLELEKTWIDVPVGNHVFHDLWGARWSMSPEALAATRDPIVDVVVNVVVKPVATAQETNRLIAGIIRRARRRFGL